MKNISLIDCVGVGLQSVVIYTYIGSKTYLFESDTIKSFINKLNLKPTLSGLKKLDTPV
jgi:hypothetical protein